MFTLVWTHTAIKNEVWLEYGVAGYWEVIPRAYKYYKPMTFNTKEEAETYITIKWRNSGTAYISVKPLDWVKREAIMEALK